MTFTKSVRSALAAISLRLIPAASGAVALVLGEPAKAQDGPNYRDESDSTDTISTESRAADAGIGGIGDAAHQSTISTGSISMGGNDGWFGVPGSSQTNVSDVEISSVNEGSSINVSGGDFADANLNDGNQSTHTSDTTDHTKTVTHDRNGGDNNVDFSS